MSRKYSIARIVMVSVCLCVASGASGAVILSGTSNLNGLGGGHYDDASSIPVSNSDLINGLAPLATNYNGCCEAAGGTAAPLTDGTTGSGISDPTTSANSLFDLGGQPGNHPQPWYVEYDLGSSTAIASIVVTSGHQDSRLNQSYDLLVSNDGVTFTSLSDASSQALGSAGAGFNYSPSNGDGGAAQSTVFNDASAVLATARYVEFIALDNGNGVFRELDVIAAVPEPASMALLGVGAIGLLVAGRRRRSA